MHYLTKLFLDAAALRKENIRDDYSIHRLVYSLFPLEQERSRFLYADKGSVRGGRLLLVLSEKNQMCRSMSPLQRQSFRKTSSVFPITGLKST